MACKPTYKGVRYNSIAEIKDVINADFRKLSNNSMSSSVENQQQVRDMEGNTYSTSNSKIITYKTEVGDINYIVGDNGDMIMVSKVKGRNLNNNNRASSLPPIKNCK